MKLKWPESTESDYCEESELEYDTGELAPLGALNLSLLHTCMCLLSILYKVYILVIYLSALF